MTKQTFANCSSPLSFMQLWKRVGSNVSLCVRDNHMLSMDMTVLNVEFPVVSLLNVCVCVFGSLSADRCSYSTQISDPDQPQHPDPSVIRDTYNHHKHTRSLSYTLTQFCVISIINPSF